MARAVLKSMNYATVSYIILVVGGIISAIYPENRALRAAAPGDRYPPIDSAEEPCSRWTRAISTIPGRVDIVGEPRVLDDGRDGLVRSEGSANPARR